MRLSSLQFLRAIAAWMVVFHHYNQVLFNWDMSNSILGFELGEIFRVYGKLGVDIFFVISGFIMYYSLYQKATTSRVFLINRIVRVVPVYWFYTFLLLSLLSLDLLVTKSDYTASSLLKSLFFVPHQNPSGTLGIFPFLTVGWTLNFEMFFYTLLALMLALLRSKVMMGTVLLLIALPIIWSELDLSVLGFESILSSNYLYEFAIGIIVGRVYCSKGRFFKNNNILSLLFIFIGLFFMMLHGQGESYAKYISVTSIVVGFLYMNDSLYENKIGRFLCYLGNISYSTYLVHSIIIFILATYFEIDPSLSVFKETLILALYVFGIFTSSALSHKFLETGKLNKQFKMMLNVLFLIKSGRSVPRDAIN